MLARIKTVLRLVVLAVVVSGLAFLAFMYWANFSEGTRSGRLIKLSKRGILFKTYEGQLDVGGMQPTNSAAGPSFTSLWDFSADGSDRKLVGLLEQNQGRPVKLYYSEKYYRFFWRGDTKYFVNRVEPLP